MVSEQDVTLTVEKLQRMTRSRCDPKSGQLRWKEVKAIREAESETWRPDCHMGQL